tara:strand:- start:63 stop:701 length:639 start_codon:yes stop_codon:yes gene_type:complete
MEFLIDRKVWNKVIKKVNPNLGLLIKQGLKKDSISGEYKLKRECVLFLTNRVVFYGFCSALFDSYFYKSELLKSLQKDRKPKESFIELERAILEVLIETQGLPNDLQYNINGNCDYVIAQDENLEIVEKGFVYFIRNEDIYKIGKTDNLLRRFNQLRPHEILNVVRCSNYEILEQELLKKFKNNRIPQTEYFRLNKYQIEQVHNEMMKGAEF